MCNYHNFEKYGANSTFCMACGSRWSRQDKTGIPPNKAQLQANQAIASIMKDLRVKAATIILTTPDTGLSGLSSHRARNKIYA